MLLRDWTETNLLSSFFSAQGENREIGLGSFTKIHPKLGQKIVGGDDAKVGMEL